MSKFADSVRHKRGGTDIPVGTACLGGFHVPFLVCAEDQGVMDMYYITLDIIQSEGTNFTATHHAESTEENGNFQFRVFDGIHQRLYFIVREDIKLWTFFVA